jgi:hypothetical protein
MDEGITTTTITSTQTLQQGGQSVATSGLIPSMSTVRQRLAKINQERDFFN